jgi:hydrogenase maturation protein HypF
VTCGACRDEIFSPYEDRFRYPFTNCTHCGPRFSILERVPYDRAHTSMKAFAMCATCRAQYEDAADRRYHAQPIACHRCGPQVRLERADGRAFSLDRFTMHDAVDAIATIVQQGDIVAVKGLGCFHLVCDATRADAVQKLRARKRRPHKPFALLVRDLEVAARYVDLDPVEVEALTSTAGPIVLARRRAEPVSGAPVAAEVAPDQPTLGVMLPPTPLHHLLMKRLARPVVCTSGNLTEEPPCTDDEEARSRLGDVADWFVLNDRPIRNRVEDSIVRQIDGRVRTLRRARGFAPAPVRLPPGFEEAPDLLAMGGHLKSAFGLLTGGKVVLSPYHGDLDHPAAIDAWQRALDLHLALFDHGPAHVAVDAHPEYAPTKLGENLARARDIGSTRVHHHHAHVAACLVENGWPRSAKPVLGVAFDGVGMGEHGALWGGEFLVADYGSAERVGTIKPVAWIGGDKASREPWRNLYAHLRAEMSWGELELNFGDVDVVQRLAKKPRDLLEQALAKPHLSPRVSSAGRLFDAVAAAIDLFFEGTDYEGQAAIALEGLVTDAELEAARNEERYPVGLPLLPESKLPYLEWLGMWRAILGDRFAGTSPARIAARFHVALADGVIRMAERVRKSTDVDTVALTGGVFQNRVLTEEVARGLREKDFRVLLHAELPANDGGLAIGQAAIAAAHSLERRLPCV